MRTKIRTRRSNRGRALWQLALALGWASTALGQDVGTAFTYQGQLKDGGAAPTGLYDFQFRLFDPGIGQIAPTLTVDNLQVTGGLFTTVLDFGDVYTGRRRDLEIAVRPGASAGAFTTLSPRQELTATPHAAFSLQTASLEMPFAQTGTSPGAPVGTPLFSISDNGVGAVASFATASNNGFNSAVSVFTNAGTGLASRITGIGGQAATFIATSPSHAGQVVLMQSNGGSDALLALTQVQGTGHAALFRNFNSSNTTPTVLVDTNSGLPNAIALHATLSGSPSVGSFAAAVKGSAGNGNFGIGVWGDHGGGAWGVYGSTNTGIGVAGSATSPTGFAGYFAGKVEVDGRLFMGNEGDPNATLAFPDVSAAAPPMIEMFSGGISNVPRMVLAHSDAFPNWGLQYDDNGDRFNFLGGGNNAVTVDLGNRRLGVRTATPAFDLEVNGSAGKPGGGSWSAASDMRLKTNVRDLHGTLERLLGLRGVSFEYKDPGAIHQLPGEQTGMIAQEVEKVFPQWVDEDAAGYKRLTYRGFEALTVEALRDLRDEKDGQISELRAENQELRDRLAALEARLEQLNASQQGVAK